MPMTLRQLDSVRDDYGLFLPSGATVVACYDSTIPWNADVALSPPAAARVCDLCLRRLSFGDAAKTVVFRSEQHRQSRLRVCRNGVSCRRHAPPLNR